jgi:hypothetical protein
MKPTWIVTLAACVLFAVTACAHTHSTDRNATHPDEQGAQQKDQPADTSDD